MRARLFLFGLAALAFTGLALVAASAFASKEVVRYFGAEGSLGGQFNGPGDVAVNDTGNGGVSTGTTYVVDKGNNRIDRFDPEGNFVSAWGANLLTEPVDEVQRITVNATAGSYKLRFEGASTASVPYNANSFKIEAALGALPSAVGGVFVTKLASNPYSEIQFHGPLGATNVGQISIDTSELTGTAAVTTTIQGSGQYEICTVAAECRAGARARLANVNNNAKNGSLNSPQSVAVDEDTGNVYVSDFNQRVSEYDAAGAFIRSFGFGVDASAAGESYEVCPAAHRCTTGIAGSGVGQVGATSTEGTLGLTVSPPDGEASTGTVFLADSKNRRVNTYKLDGASPSSFGSSATFGEIQPRQIAVDSRGIVYLSNSKEGGEIERYDTEDANGGGVGFLAPIASATDESQVLTFSGFDGPDTFTLTCPNGETTAPIGFGENADFYHNVIAALEAKCGAGNTDVSYRTEHEILVFYRGTFAETDVPQTNCTVLTGSGSCQVSTEANGHAGALRAGPPATATADLAVHPDSDGAGPDADTLYVLRAPFGPKAVQQFGPANQPGLTVAPTTADETHGQGADFTVVSGLGLDDQGGRLFVSGSSSKVPDRHVFVLEERPAPEATVDPITTVGAHSATLTGSVNRNGAETSYRFEYVGDAEFGATGFENALQQPLSDENVGHDETPVSVEAEIPDLVAGTTYHVRLLAKRLFGGAEAIGGPLTFTTESVAPTIDGTAATVSGEEEATLRAAINPENEPVSDYHFEWGADTSYGNSTQAGGLSPGSEPVAVEEPLTGLTPGQTYHYRIVATNASGTATGSDESFTAPAGPPHFPQRGYEIASQYPTGGVPYVEITGRLTPSEDGDSVAFQGTNPLPGTTEPPLPGQPWHADESPSQQYLSRRGPDGWHVSQTGPFGQAWSTDLKRMLVVAGASAPGSGDAYEDRRVNPDDWNHSYDVYEWQPGGSLTWVSRDPRIPVGVHQTAPGNASAGAEYQDGMSADGRTVALESPRQLLDADTTPASGALGTNRLYKWEDGRLSFVGVRPDGSVPTGGSHQVGAVSRDGSRVVWRAGRDDSGNAGESLYVQTDGQPTVEATRGEGVGTLPDGQPYDVKFQSASADDSRIFFTSSSRLTPDSGASASRGKFGEPPASDDLYVYDVNAHRLRDLTPRLDGIDEPSVEPTNANEARVLDVAGNSTDGRRVYFTADARYPTAPNPEGELPSAAGSNLYMAELDGIEDPIKLRFVASHRGAGSFFETAEGKVAYNEGTPSLASPDGSVLGFASTRSLTGQPLGKTEQLFVYDAMRDTLNCASCPTDGSLPSGNVNRYFVFGDENIAWQGTGYSSLSLRHWVSSDGAVFFDTPVPLLPADQNTVGDVYEYREGGLRLISSGTATADARLSNATVDGSTVFFDSFAALAPQDKEPGIPKLYAARVGGGFPYVAPTPPCDYNAGACEGAQSTAPDVPGAGTAVFQGPGNPAPKHHRAKKKRRHHRKRRHHVRRHGRRHRKRSNRRAHARTAKYNRRAGR